MSKENVKLFYETLTKDEALQEKTRVIGKKYEGQKLDEKRMEEIYQKELVPLAREAGYDFSLAEVKEYAAEASKPGMREISEEELAAVAGGGCCVCAAVGVGDWGGGDMECSCIGYGSGHYSSTEKCFCIIGGGGG